MQNNTASGHAAALTTILIWGTTFISTKVLLQDFAPAEILFIRFVIGYGALWCIYPRRLRAVPWRQECCFAAAGLCGITLYYLLENIALTHTQASNVGVILSAAPFFTALIACLLRRERPAGRFLVGFFIAMGGIALISFGGGAALHLNPWGDLLALLAAAVWAVYATLAKKLASFGYSTVLTTRRTFFYGLVFMAPALAFMDFHVEISNLLGTRAVLNLLFLGLGASALCFVTWNQAVKVLGAVKTSVYIYMVPVVTATTSAVILGEPMTGFTLCGIGLTLLGLYLSENRSRRREAAMNGLQP